jgi:2-hydroxy-3-oxopropionate reductase
MKVGFIGLGAMGRPMALHLHAAGHELFVWARRPESAAGLPATLCATPAELGAAAKWCSPIITSSADVEAVASAQWLIEGMAPDSVLVDCSTIAPDAPATSPRNSPKKASTCSTPRSPAAPRAPSTPRWRSWPAAMRRCSNACARCSTAWASASCHIGPNGAGQVAKACNQMIMVAAIEAAAEALRLAAASGVDCAKVKQALAGGSAASRVLDVMGERMVKRDFAAGIEARLHHKDFGLVLEAARKSGVPVPLTATVAQQLNALMAQGWGEDDTASLLRVLDDLNERFPESGRNVFVARPGGIHVQFSSGPARKISFEGAPAFAVDLPKFIMRMQRRECFRIETPRVRPLQFHARLPGNELLTLPAHDIFLSPALA